MQIEVSGFRSQLTKILGADHPAMAVFPKFVTGSITPENVASYAEDVHVRMVEIIHYLESISMPIGQGSKVFLGHGRSPVWRELKDFIHDRVGLGWDEGNLNPASAPIPLIDQLILLGAMPLDVRELKFAAVIRNLKSIE